MIRKLWCRWFHKKSWRFGRRWYYADERPGRGVRWAYCEKCERSWSESE